MHITAVRNAFGSWCNAFINREARWVLQCCRSISLHSSYNGMPACHAVHRGGAASIIDSPRHVLLNYQTGRYFPSSNR